ncbi:substrate-binding domain-containing protein [Geobacter sp. DSM 9736]|uniref:substrate-binding domain-containing protein n=1 Tax=Geobacter sp. DSM 9736 TaxID=1277350 RepID=UPI000B502F20|nr:substrate-binding domain-containing protein [Geobacter sp. DSM 9736]SNB44656.1 phosphate transport system substrate-binding protein [Geobacter sp. DSM 9736]
MNKAAWIFFLLLTAWPFSGRAEEIVIAGGGAAIAHVFAPMKEDFEKNTGIVLTLKPMNAVKALVTLQEEKADAATAAHSLRDLVQNGARDGIKLDASAFRSMEVAQNRLVVMVNKANRISALDRSQLRDLFSGRITNWKELGGADEPVTVVWGTDTVGQNSQFVREVLDGEPVSSAALKVTDYLSIRDKVASVPGAVGIDPQGFVNASINVPDIPLISSPIMLFTKGEPPPKIKKLLEFYEAEFSFVQ